ncbi:MAG TPA: hypothetical protein VF392_04905 [Terracidiphilus sp.]
MTKNVLLIVCMLGAFAPIGLTQVAGQPMSSGVRRADSGVYGALTILGAKDSVNGYSSLWTPAIGYDLPKHFSLEAGIPYYALASSAVQKVTASRSGVGTETVETSSANLLGDMYLLATGHFEPSQAFRYQINAKGTAPTGDTTNGISTGRATWNVSNHIEAGSARVIPYLEAGIGNSTADTAKYYRSYTTLGYIAPFAAGLNIDLGHHISFDASTYYDLPFGDQKLYSREVPSGTVIGASGRRNRPILDQYMSQGGAGLTEDHGFNGSLAFSPTERVTFTASYNRSIPDALDSVAISLSLRFGHASGAAAK